MIFRLPEGKAVEVSEGRMTGDVDALSRDDLIGLFAALCRVVEDRHAVRGLVAEAPPLQFERVTIPVEILRSADA